MPEKLPNHRKIESNRPVEIVTGDVAMAFCKWLSAELNKDIRLPTVQQWEKANGAASKQGEYLHLGEFRFQAVLKFSLRETSAVGIYSQVQLPSKALDMSGNIWEFCLKKHDETKGVTAGQPHGIRLVCGSPWAGNSLSSSKSPPRPSHAPKFELRYDARGFRLVC